LTGCIIPGNSIMAYGTRARKLPPGFWAGAGKMGRGTRKATSSKAIVRKAVKKAQNSIFAKKVMSVVNRREETKYVSEYIAQNQLVTAGASVPGNLNRMIVGIAQGTADNERIGDKINPVRAVTRITVHFQATPSGGPNGPFSDVEVHCLVLAVKGARTSATVALTPANTLLKLGNGANGDPSVGTYTQTAFIENINHLPVNTDQFTVLKKYKHRFAKGDFDLNGPASAAAGAQRSVTSPCHTFTYGWKPPALDYNDSADVFPTNHYPVYIMWVSALDGGPYSGNVTYGTQTQMYFKDA